MNTTIPHISSSHNSFMLLLYRFKIFHRQDKRYFDDKEWITQMNVLDISQTDKYFMSRERCFDKFDLLLLWDMHLAVTAFSLSRHESMGSVLIYIIYLNQRDNRNVIVFNFLHSYTVTNSNSFVNLVWILNCIAQKLIIKAKNFKFNN